MYYLLLAPLYIISLLPFWVLYRISDFAFFMLYHVLGYRKQIVWDNLKHAFPEKTTAELLIIRKKFYKNFCDQWIETIKLLTIPYRNLDRRLSANWNVIKQLGTAGKNTYLIAGHTFNWEWANVAFPLNIPQQYACVYLPANNKGFDSLISRIRSRSGAWMISMRALKSGFSRLNTKQHVLTLAADQNPEPALIGFAEWISFLNREVPVFKGPEQISRKAKAAVVFCAIRKAKRGNYYMNFSHYCDDASQTRPGEILRAYIGFLEEQIRQQPENWLWSHRRWKHVRKENLT